MFLHLLLPVLKPHREPLHPLLRTPRIPRLYPAFLLLALLPLSAAATFGTEFRIRALFFIARAITPPQP
ncbi:hypothetical protein [Granulicella arctica]|uniref:Uncharacterized protein n=1 Tax=Granulicella arctica TaxID=940613 RepID=A0A7Y9PET4_9BACT|nr:hypothetical protein [Granulicella arctica]NYF78586.1 hypothetical protein [Granulicella arctica]